MLIRDGTRTLIRLARAANARPEAGPGAPHQPQWQLLPWLLVNVTGNKYLLCHPLSILHRHRPFGFLPTFL